MAVIPADRHLLEKVTKKQKPKNERAIDAMVAKTPPKMNKWEQQFADWLESEKKAGRIKDWGSQRIKLRLPGGSWYMPDFDVLESDALEQFAVAIADAYRVPRRIVTGPRQPIRRTALCEVKGFLREKARLKIEAAAAAFPQFEFWVAYRSVDGNTGSCPFRLERIER